MKRNVPKSLKNLLDRIKVTRYRSSVFFYVFPTIRFVHFTTNFSFDFYFFFYCFEIQISKN